MTRKYPDKTVKSTLLAAADKRPLRASSLSSHWAQADEITFDRLSLICLSTCQFG